MSEALLEARTGFLEGRAGACILVGRAGLWSLVGRAISRIVSSGGYGLRKSLGTLAADGVGWVVSLPS